jgi:hypothetical protein
MQQRRLRLGDILDDYCPRERRITNHAVVAMIEDEVKQTRCTTCDADHVYKQARVPARRKKDAGVLFADVGAPVRPRAAAAFNDGPPDAVAMDDEFGPAPLDEPLPDIPLHVSSDEEPVHDGEADADEPRIEEDGPVHRRLIRATLPRPEGQTPEWKDPDFTIRQPGNGRGGFDGNRNGHRPGRGRTRSGRGPGQAPTGSQTRFSGPRHGSGRGGHGQQGQGANRPGRPGQGHGQGHGHGPGHGQNRGPRPGGPGRKRGR